MFQLPVPLPYRTTPIVFELIPFLVVGDQGLEYIPFIFTP